MPCGWPLRWPAVVFPADPPPWAPGPTCKTGGVDERARARGCFGAQPAVLASLRLGRVQLKGPPMVPRRVPASQQSADGADPRLSLHFLLNQDGTTDGSRGAPTAEAVQGGTPRHPTALPPHPEARTPLHGVDFYVERGRATDRGVAPTGVGPHLPLPPPPRREAPAAHVTLAPLHERFPPSLPLPALRPQTLPLPLPTPPPARPTLEVAATTAATPAPAVGQGLVAPPSTTVGGEMPAPQGFVEHGVRWNVVTERYDVTPTEAIEARPTVSTSGGTGQSAGRGDQQGWQGAAAAVTETMVAASGTDVGAPPPLRHPDSLAAPFPDHPRALVPTPVLRAAGPMGVHAARGGSPMAGVARSTGGTQSGNTGGHGGRNGSSDSGGLDGAVGTVGTIGASNGRGGRGGGRRGGGRGGGGRSRRGSGGRPRVPCSRDGCTSTFAQRAGALGGGGPNPLHYFFLSFLCSSMARPPTRGGRGGKWEQFAVGRGELEGGWGGRRCCHLCRCTFDARPFISGGRQSPRTTTPSRHQIADDG